MQVRNEDNPFAFVFMVIALIVGMYSTIIREGLRKRRAE